MTLSPRPLTPEQKAGYEVFGNTDARPASGDADLIIFRSRDGHWCSWNELVAAYRCGRRLPG